MKKRCLAALLAMVLCLTLLPTAALADDSDFVIVDGVLEEYIGSGGEVIIPDGVTCIRNYAFNSGDSWTTVTSVTIPDSVTTIEIGTFYTCCNLTDIVVDPDNTRYTARDSVLFTKDMTQLVACPAKKGGAYTIPTGVTSIEDFAFYLCTGLTSVAIPEGVTDIKFFAFAHCEGLTGVDIPESVTSIEEGTFHCCTGLTRITIPSHVTSVESAFYGCANLTDILADPDNQDYTSVDGVLFTKDRKTVVAYPGGRQGSYAIPAGVTEIGSRAFDYCPGLTDVTIPDSVTSIGEFAFFDCPNVKVYGKAGSAAEQYCRENELPFVVWIAPATAQEGELEGNGGKSVYWTVTETGEVTVDVKAASLAPEEVILLGCYDLNGRLTGVKVLDADHAAAQIDPSTPNVRLFWLNAASQPQSASVTVWGK